MERLSNIIVNLKLFVQKKPDRCAVLSFQLSVFRVRNWCAVSMGDESVFSSVAFCPFAVLFLAFPFLGSMNSCICEAFSVFPSVWSFFDAHIVLS